ncbi:hypothetical protein HDU96_009755 [Phlyctochytrium bullatum]|nr:hypothetical protein HDU96_009755 [Phlyctochytrium bullatum]
MATADIGVDVSESSSGSDVISLIQLQFFQSWPLRTFRWSNTDDSVRWDDESLQHTVLDATIDHPRAIRYPPSTHYRTRFLKKLVDLVEQTPGAACSDRLMEAYMDCMSPAAGSGEELETSYRSYRLDTQLSPTWITLKEDKTSISNGTTGLRTWQAAYGMYLFLKENTHRISGKRLVELGSGPGFTGLCCMALGASSIVLTDRNPQVLDRLAENVRINFPDSPGIRIEDLDWDTAEASQLTALAAHADCIVASDVSYDDTFFPGLSRMLQALLAGGAVEALIALTLRSDATFAKFVDALAHVGIRVAEQHRVDTALDACGRDAFWFEEPAPVLVLSLQKLGE